MKKIFEWLGGFALIVFSFYFTDKVSLLVANKGDLMQEIKAVSSTYYQEPVNAEIDKKDNTIIPGIYGKKIDEKESYLSMKEFGIFNKNYLVYTKIKPQTTLKDNKDKFIVSGNPEKRNISLIVDDNKEIVSLLINKKIKYDELIKNPSQTSSGEIINGGSNSKDFSSIMSDKKICLYGYSNIEECLKKDYYIIKTNLELNSSSIITIKDQIKPGTLILISNSASVEHMKILLNEIKYKDLNIVYVSELVDEEA